MRRTPPRRFDRNLLNLAPERRSIAWRDRLLPIAVGVLFVICIAFVFYLMSALGVRELIDELWILSRIAAETGWGPRFISLVLGAGHGIVLLIVAYPLLGRPHWFDATGRVLFVAVVAYFGLIWQVVLLRAVLGL